MFERRDAEGTAGAARLAAPGEDVLALVRAVLGQLQDAAALGSDAERWSSVVRAQVIGVLDRLPSVAAAVRAPVLVAQGRAAAAVGARRELADQRARSTGVSRGQATAQLEAAEKIVELAGVGAAVAQGEMQERHVQVLSQVMARAGEAAVSALSSAQGQARVVELARSTDPRQFGREITAIVAAHEPEAFDDARAAARRERSFELSHTPRGTLLKGFLDPLAGQALQRALDATGHRPDPDRTASQARADALTALATHALAATATAGSGSESVGEGLDRVVTAGVVPQVSLLVPAEAWWAVRERQAARSAPNGVSGGPRPQGRVDGGPRAPGGADRTEPTGGARPPAMTEDGTVLSADELAAALCDCSMTRVVMSAQGLPLDVGRARRSFTPAQRLAVVARDRRCVWDGCGIVPAYCELHHIRWWGRDQGETSVQNAVLLCSFHHHLVHQLDLSIEREAPPPERPAWLAPRTDRPRIEQSRAERETSERPPGERPPAGRLRYTFRRRNGAIYRAPAAVDAAPP
jgi:Domain of unknown function (DUF222)